MSHVTLRSARRATLVAAVALTVVGAAGCSDDVTAPEPVALQLTARAARDTIGASDTVTVILVARNGGSAPVTVHTANGCATSLRLRIAPLQGGIAISGPLGTQRTCLNPADVTIAPGASISETAVVRTQTFLGDEMGASGQPGRYLLVPVVNDGSGDTRRAADATPVLIVVR